MSGFTQEQNEALVRLMLAARYQDSKLSLSESDEIRRQVDNMEWESRTAPDIFVMQETASVREALASEEGKLAFMKAQCEAFTDPEAKGSAMETIEAVLSADGIDPKENELITQLKGMLEL